MVWNFLFLAYVSGETIRRNKSVKYETLLALSYKHNLKVCFDIDKHKRGYFVNDTIDAKSTHFYWTQ